MKVAVVVLNWNGKKYIGKCLKSLQQLEAERIVVDNASTDGSVPYLKKNFPQVKLIINSQNLGYAEGNNVGIRHALDYSADYIWIVNPDITVGPQALQILLNFASTHPQAGILGSKVYFVPGFEFHKNRYTKAQIGKVIWYAGGQIDWNNVITNHLGMNEVDTGQFDTAKITDFVTGASMLLNSQMLRQVGILDPKYYLYYEETDLSLRSRRAGWELWYVPTSTVWHANAQATGVGSQLVDYYTTRNRILFGMRWAPLRSKIALVRESMRLLASGRLWQKRGVLDFYLGRWGRGTYA